jgi:GIY-YIG catalytic domain
MIKVDEVLKESIKRTRNLLSELERCKVASIKTIEINSNLLFIDKERGKLIDSVQAYKNKYIYILKVNVYSNELETIKNAYKAFDARNKPRVLGITLNASRFNKGHESEYLYVGSSKNIKSRIRQHLGDGNLRTYSLHLKHWFPKKINLALYIYEIDSQNHEVIEAIEQGIWDIIKPIFGKRSGQ